MAVDPDRFPADADLRAGRDEGAVRVLFVGRLVPEKGPDVLLDAVQRVLARDRRVEVAVVGAGPLAGDLRRTVDERGLAGVVRLLGAVGQDDLPAWYRWADVFCLPSYAEGVPVVLMEAMATELPVVTTPVAGIPELVEDGVSGHLVAPGDAAAVADALVRLVDDPQTRAALGRRGRARVLAEFAPETNARRLARLLGLTVHDRRVELPDVPAARSAGAL
nr:glycosyltransferase family 4 protein [Kineococcus siccus]